MTIKTLPFMRVVTEFQATKNTFTNMIKTILKEMKEMFSLKKKDC